jgi:predicted enzyme related to lactoylglutathione lyase
MKFRNAIGVVVLALIAWGTTPLALAAGTGSAASEIGFSGLATLDLQVRDRAEALEWFSRVLGFEHLFTEESINWAEVRSPVLKLTVGIEEIRDRPIRTTSFDFGVRDIAAARKALEQRGAEFVGPTVDYGPVLIARLRDPSGNMFNLFQGK